METLARRALELVEVKPTPVILIDGRAGAGKSTFASLLQDKIFRLGEPSPTIVKMDDLYPGWDGLCEGSRYLVDRILYPISKGKRPAWQAWNWLENARGRPGEVGNGWREITGGNTVIIEGCGSVSRASSQLSDITCWVEATTASRYRRIRLRDGGKFDHLWPSWEVQHDTLLDGWNAKENANYVVVATNR